jgi:hypothetical protein
MAGGAVTIACFAPTVKSSPVTVTLPGAWAIERTGLWTSPRVPRRLATSSAIRCEPPSKRHICAPSRVLKLRSNVPGWFSSPEAAS